MITFSLVLARNFISFCLTFYHVFGKKYSYLTLPNAIYYCHCLLKRETQAWAGKDLRCVTAAQENPVRWKDLGHLQSRTRKIHAGCLPCRWPAGKRPQNYSPASRRKLEIMTPLEIMALEIYGCIDVCVHTGTSAWERCCWMRCSRWECTKQAASWEQLNTAIKLSAAQCGTYQQSSRQLGGAVWDGHRSPSALACRTKRPACIGTASCLRAGVERKCMQKADTMCHPGIRLIAALWSIAQGSGLLGNYQGMQRQPESFLWSLRAVSDLPKCQGDRCLRPGARPLLPGHNRQAFMHCTGYISAGAYQYCRAVRQLLVQPSLYIEKWELLFDIYFKFLQNQFWSWNHLQGLCFLPLLK